jgi:flagellar hook-length control protein FliK
MNKLPIVSNAPQAAAKPVQASSLTASANALQTAKPAHAAEASSQGKTFGDVLARHVAEAKPVDSAPQPKKVTSKAVEKKEGAASPANKVSNNAAEKTEMDTSQSGKVSDSVAEKTDADTAPAKKVSGNAADKAEDQTAAALPGDATAKVAPDMLATLIPLNAATAQSAAVQDAATAQGAVAAQAAVIAQGVSTAQTPSAARAVSAAQDESVDQAASTLLTGAKNSPGADQVIRSAGNNAQARNTQPVDAKKDAAFSNMMESLTAATTAKLSNNDEKGAALAAAPQANAVAEAAMQAATAPVAPANVLPTQVTINTPVSHEKWGDEFNQKITWLSSQKEQTAELHLNPPQLGPMDVVLKVSGDQATALFTSPHAAVREAIEQAMPRLREMMAESGIMLGNATVSDQAPRGRQDNQESKSSNSRSSIGGVSESTMAGNLNARVSPINRHNGIVDTFA